MHVDNASGVRSIDKLAHGIDNVRAPGNLETAWAKQHADSNGLALEMVLLNKSYLYLNQQFLFSFFSD